MHPDHHPVLHGLTVRRAPRHNPLSCFDTHKYLLSSVIQVLQDERGHGLPAGPAILLRVVHSHSPFDPGADDDAETSSLLGELLGGESQEPRPFALSVFDVQRLKHMKGPLARELLRLAPVPQAQTAGLTPLEMTGNSIVHLAWSPHPPGDALIVHSCNAADQCVTHRSVAGRWQRTDDDGWAQAFLQQPAMALGLSAALRLRALVQGVARTHRRASPGQVPDEVFTSADELVRRFNHIVVRAALRELQNREAMETDYRSVWL